jgi:hypothetical protein
MGVLQLLSWEPDHGNQSVVPAFDRVEKQPRCRGHQGDPVSKSATGSLSLAQPLVSESAQQELWITLSIVVVTRGA